MNLCVDVLDYVGFKEVIHSFIHSILPAMYLVSERTVRAGLTLSVVTWHRGHMYRDLEGA